MTSEEKSVWIMGVVAVATYGIYLSTIFSLADGPIQEVAYAWPMVWTIVSAIVASIILHILVAAIWPREAGSIQQCHYGVNMVTLECHYGVI